MTGSFWAESRNGFSFFEVFSAESRPGFEKSSLVIYISTQITKSEEIEMFSFFDWKSSADDNEFKY